MLIKFLKSLENIIIPETCLLCKDTNIVRKLGGANFCANCIKKISWQEGNLCELCGVKMSDAKYDTRICEECTKNKIYFNKCYSVFEYNDFTKNFISEFKYKDKSGYAGYFANIICEKFQAEIAFNDIIIPVPIDYYKLLRRKYNQAALLAKFIAKNVKLDFGPLVIKKVRATKPQAELSYYDRKKLSSELFKIEMPYKIMRKKVALIDDVMTTGTTVNMCAKALKESGAIEVNVFTIARNNKVVE